MLKVFGDETDKYKYEAHLHYLVPEPPKYPAPKVMIEIHVFDKATGEHLRQAWTSVKFSDDRELAKLAGELVKLFTRLRFENGLADGRVNEYDADVQKKVLLQELEKAVNEGAKEALTKGEKLG